jgi:hypothetical protein
VRAEHVVKDEHMVVPDLLGGLSIVADNSGVVADLGLGEDDA